MQKNFDIYPYFYNSYNFFILASWKESNSKSAFKENYIIRPEYGEGKLEVILQADIKEQEENYNTTRNSIRSEGKKIYRGGMD